VHCHLLADADQGMTMLTEIVQKGDKFRLTTDVYAYPFGAILLMAIFFFSGLRKIFTCAHLWAKIHQNNINRIELMKNMMKRLKNEPKRKK